MANSVVILDIGGVLETDAFEVSVLSKGVGMADQLGWDPRAALQAHKDTVPTAYVAPTTRSEYWQQWSTHYNANPSRLGEPVIFSPAFVSQAESFERRLVRTNPYAPELLRTFRDSGVELGLCSNTTTFWWEGSLDRHALRGIVNPRLALASCEVGELKSKTGKMFARAVSALRACGHSSALYIDDRVNNVALSQAVGLTGLHYNSAPQHEGETVQAADDVYVAYTFRPFDTAAIMDTLHSGMSGM